MDKPIRESYTLGNDTGYKINCGSDCNKARRTLYSLMKPGLHGENGLDPVTCLHLFTVYLMPVLLHSLEICLPTDRVLHRLAMFLKKVLIHILSLPVTTADAEVYILFGM